MQHLKKFILENCLTIKGTLNNRVIDPKWWIIRNHESIYNEILHATNFLSEEKTLTQRIYHIVNEKTSIPKCPVCGKDINFKSYIDGYFSVCSKECIYKHTERDEKRKQTNIEKYGNCVYLHSKEGKRKSIENNKQKYGVEYITQTENFKQKSSKTKELRYGDKNFNNQEKAKQTNIEKYGVEYTCQNVDVILKIQESKNLTNSELRDKNWLLEQNKTKNIQQIADELSVTYRTVWLWMIKHNIDFITHIPKDYKAQKEIYEYIISLIPNTRILYNDRKKINPKELDIFIPDYNLAIEHNGIWHHKENKDRHLQKLNLCKEKDVKLLQFWDFQWLYKKNICKSIIKSNLGINTKIYARKCSIVEVSSKQYTTFLEQNHMQGVANSSIRYGLEFNNELVAVIGFSKSRYNKNYDYELIRYANKLDTNVIGGFSRLLKHFKKIKLGTVISYCDKMLFDGRMYKENSFKFLYDSKPGFFYSNNKIIKSRESLQKHKLKDILQEFDENLTADTNLTAEGWYKVWDCGNSVWSLE